MHETSYRNMIYFVKNHLTERSGKPLKILDIGSRDVNGTFRPLFQKPGWTYTGLDMEPGENVDIVVRQLYRWKQVRSNSFDVVISGSTFEHVEYFWITMMEIERVLKYDGLFCLIVPSSGPEHKYPLDCWRFYPDGLRALARFAFLEILEVHLASERTMESVAPDQWNDCQLIAKKNKHSFLKRQKISLMRNTLRLL
jgi:SAM-dependent methyltransferase